jgi:outer membrane protein OmpA-like peptidoglycan-associated protein
MRTTTISIITLLGLAFALPAAAEVRASKQEAIGFGTGAVVGAAAGGPIGFIIGAAIGGTIGDSMHRKNESIEDLSASLDSSRTTIAHLERDVDTLGDRIEHLQDISRPELVDLLQAGIAMDLLFRTDEYALADTTGGRFASLASTLASMPDIRVQLDGFADERGDDEYNLELSKKRVDFVRDLLIQAGVSETSINVTAHGEAIAQDDTEDSFALERRVSVTLFIDDSQSVASASE